MKNMEKRNELLAQKTIEALKQRNFGAYYCKNSKEAVQKIIELTSKTESFSWGGSVTIDEIKIKQYLKENGYKTIDRDKAKTQEEKRDLIFEGLKADNFLMSANAISQDGQIVNIDGMGNRLSALCWGPKKIFIVAGINKITQNHELALKKARNQAAPINAQRVNDFSPMETPCLKSGICADCKSQTSICCQILTTRLSRPKERINVILINENLGY